MIHLGFTSSNMGRLEVDIGTGQITLVWHEKPTMEKIATWQGNSEMNAQNSSPVGMEAYPYS